MAQKFYRSDTRNRQTSTNSRDSVSGKIKGKNQFIQDLISKAKKLNSPAGKHLQVEETEEVQVQEEDEQLFVQRQDIIKLFRQ